MRVLVTGASGFVGGALLRQLASDPSFEARASLRRPADVPVAETAVVGEIGPHTGWRAALEGIEAVIHCAGRAHQIDDPASDPLTAFRLTNVEGTRRLAEEAAAAGVRRLVFLSSVKVHGEATPSGRPFREDDIPAPVDPYGVSKREAEAGLRRIAERTGLETVIIRPPLVYGPNPKANMLRLLRWVSSGLPLPFGSVRNSRSMVSLGNLVSAVTVAATHPAAAGQTYLVSDQQDVSTPALIRHIAEAFGRPANLWPAPVGLLRLAGKVTGRAGEVERLVGSLVVDSGLLSRQLGWRPLQTLEEGIAEMVASHMA